MKLKTLTYTLLWMGSIITLALLFGSCQPDPLQIRDVHQVIFDKDNPEIYLFADLEKPEDGWVKHENGKMYAFTLKGNVVSVRAPRYPLSVKFYKNALDTKPDNVDFNGSTFSGELTEYGVFRIEY